MIQPGDGRSSTIHVLHVLPTDLARGSQVHARALREALDSPEQTHRLLTIFASPERGLQPDEALGVPLSRWRGAGIDPRGLWALRGAVRRLDPDVIVAHGGEALKYAALVRGHRQLVFYAIGVVMPKARRWPLRQVYTALCRRADLVAGVSQAVVDECAALFAVPADRLALAPNGRDPQRYAPAVRREPPTIAFVGHLTPEKRPGQAVEVVAALRARGQALRALMIGDGPLEEELRPAAAAAGVEMLGVRSDIPDLLASCDVLLFCSAREGEGMPGVLIEAGLCGVAVVATDAPGVSDVIDQGTTGLIVSIGDVAAMVEGAAELLGHPGRREAFGSAARQRCVEQFSLRASAQVWERLIASLSPVVDQTPGVD